MKELMKNTIIVGLATLASSVVFATGNPSPCADVLDFQSSNWLEGLCTAPEGTGASKRTDKRVYMGLVWSLGSNSSKSPDLLIGFRSTQINSSNSVKGADLNVRLQSSKSFALEGARLSYLGGNRNTLANLGAGYSFTNGSALLTAAVQAAHVRAGTDYLLASKNFVPYLEVNTLKRIQPVGSAYSCTTGNLRTVDQNFTANTFTPTSNGFLTLGQDLAFALEAPYFPVGSKTCFVESAQAD